MILTVVSFLFPIQLFVEECVGGESNQCLLGTMMETVAARSLFALTVVTSLKIGDYTTVLRQTVLGSLYRTGFCII